MYKGIFLKLTLVIVVLFIITIGAILIVDKKAGSGENIIASKGLANKESAFKEESSENIIQLKSEDLIFEKKSDPGISYKTQKGITYEVTPRYTRPVFKKSSIIDTIKVIEIFADYQVEKETEFRIPSLKSNPIKLPFCSFGSFNGKEVYLPGLKYDLKTSTIIVMHYSGKAGLGAENTIFYFLKENEQKKIYATLDQAKLVYEVGDSGAIPYTKGNVAKGGRDEVKARYKLSGKDNSKILYAVSENHKIKIHDNIPVRLTGPMICD